MLTDIVSLCPWKESINWFCFGSHKCNILSFPPDAKYFPSELKAIDKISPLWPFVFEPK